jgi:hypothetical protein
MKIDYPPQFHYPQTSWGALQVVCVACYYHQVPGALQSDHLMIPKDSKGNIPQTSPLPPLLTFE